MNVEPRIQAKLLDLAAVDTELTRIAHRRRTLPEQEELTRLESDRVGRKDAAVAVQIVLDDLDRDIKKLEGEVDAVRKREERDRKLLESGTVAAKALTELEHELGSLARRQGVLEDELLEVMERREATQSDYDHAGGQLSQIDDAMVDVTRRRDDAVADLDAAQQRCEADRAALVGEFPDDLLAVYDRQRSQGGVGAALLQARRCGACRIEIDRGEIARIAATAPETVVRCPECSAIMVRTKESGL
ncbi:zinc ribbon domain-containing protein [Rhodococcus sp. NPDC127528]|uniref:zinc ribbon domain-containing protein n=1 Tax=unclassified Rhodococcus (in: high G+C Gram-positive bacteria) TaxID=192944 RepID=UPI00363F7D75